MFRNIVLGEAIVLVCAIGLFTPSNAQAIECPSTDVVGGGDPDPSEIVDQKYNFFATDEELAAMEAYCLVSPVENGGYVRTVHLRGKMPDGAPLRYDYGLNSVYATAGFTALNTVPERLYLSTPETLETVRCEHLMELEFFCQIRPLNDRTFSLDWTVRGGAGSNDAVLTVVGDFFFDEIGLPAESMDRSVPLSVWAGSSEKIQVPWNEQSSFDVSDGLHGVSKATLNPRLTGEIFELLEAGTQVNFAGTSERGNWVTAAIKPDEMGVGYYLARATVAKMYKQQQEREAAQ